MINAITRQRGSGCPYCSGKKVINGVNDLQTLFPEIAKEWNYEKNGSLRPDMVSRSSNKKVWWKCGKGHEWKAIVSSRTKGTNSKCPTCSNHTVLAGFNDLQTTFPPIAKQWNYEKNGDLLPTQVVAGSGKRVWWKCENGHEWQARIIDRTKRRCADCPICKT